MMERASSIKKRNGGHDKNFKDSKDKMKDGPQLCEHKVAENKKREEEFLRRQNMMNIKNVVLLALLSRGIIFVMQVIFNGLLDDHDADVFNPPTAEHMRRADKVVMFLLGGFRRWDSIYLLHVAQYGYTYENTLAFFPGYPLLVRSVGYTIMYPLHSFLNVRSVLLISATLINLVCFVLSTLYLYQLCRLLLGKGNRAWFAAMLFCFNPASIFMSAAYTETLFSMCTFAHMYYMETHSYSKATVALAIAVSCRSNGLVLVGYPLYRSALLMLSNNPEDRKLSNLVGNWMRLSCCVLYGILPFAMFQYMAFKLYCDTERKMPIPEKLVAYGKSRGYHLATDEPSKWCHWIVPLSYTYVQSNHWKVGFLEYYTWEQIPNFMLASPVIAFSLMAMLFYIRKCGNELFELHDIRAWLNGTNGRLIPYIFHLMFLIIYGMTNAHIQILTRMVYSSTPLLYIYLSQHVAQYYTQQRKGKFVKLVLVHFVGYFVVGTFLHCNFLPWT